MSVNTVKCTNCNVVISEVLAFIRNRHDVVDNESLIRICESAFSEEEIDEAKKLLFTSTKTSQKLVSRRKNKKLKDLEDMISVFKTMDPDNIPIFVAYDLHKLPPVCFDHVDVTKLLKDILILRAEIMDIKCNYATKGQLEDFKSKMRKHESPIMNSNRNIQKTGGYVSGGSLTNTTQLPPNDSRVSLLSPTSKCAKECNDSASEVAICSTLTQSYPCTEGEKEIECVPVPLADSQVEDQKQLTMADVVKNGQWKESSRDNKWTLVRKRRAKKRFTGMTGKADSQSTGNFRAAEIKIPLFISHVNKETTESDIRDYIKTKANEVVNLEKIHMKSEKSYNAFKLYVPKHKINKFLSDELWPEGITFRRFVYFNKGREFMLVNENT